MATSGVGGVGQTAQSGNENNALRELDMDQFLGLMIAELQNQDPLNPMENSQILQQISQIREIGATGELTGTLEAVLRGQNLSNASNMIDKQINALTDDGETVSGKVERVSISNNVVKVHVDGQEIALENVREILPST